MPCHAATFSVGDTTTVLSLVIFLFGMVMLCSLWLSGSVTGRPGAGLFSKCTTLLWGLSKVVLSYRIFLILRALILDVVLQRRLLKQSAARWCIHSLIFLPFVFRFTWGLAALMASLWMPEWTWPWVMLDKNHPVTAFLFDLTGAMVILGICAALIRGIARRSERPPGFPRQDYLAFSLIFGVVMIGFILEGMRMAMTGAPGSASYAFVGYAVSRAFSDIALLADAYGIVWYYHAVLTGVFVAYLPFSRMLHILLAPIVLIMNAVSEYEHRGQQ
jgi:nitrate reductase gamma subunit